MTSDVDIVILSDEPAAFTQGVGWWSFLEGGELVRTGAWGVVIERRIALPSGLEVELDIAPTAWAHVPVDEGTRRVLSDGARPLYDPGGLLRAAMAARPPTA